MEISVKKLNNALERYMTKTGQFAPSDFMFDKDSDKDYMYIAVRRIYVIRVRKSDITVDVHPLGGHDYGTLERSIQTCAESPNHVEYQPGEIEKLNTGISVMNFYSPEGYRISINTKLFKEFYNQSIVDKGVPDNITFSATEGKASPLIMWEDDEAIGLFMPIKR